MLKEGWTDNHQHVFLYNQRRSNLSRKYSDPNNNERALLDVYQFVYDGS